MCGFQECRRPSAFFLTASKLKTLVLFQLAAEFLQDSDPKAGVCSLLHVRDWPLVQLDSISEFWSEILSLSPRFLKVNTKYFLLSLILGYFVRLVGGGRIPATSDGGHRGLETVFFVTGWYSWCLMWKQWCSFWKNQTVLKAKQPLVFWLSMV